MSQTAVIILNWNGKEYLRQFLPFLIKHTCLPGVNLLVADNGSIDGSAEFLRKEFPSVGLLELDRNYGFAEGYNKAIEQTPCDYVVLLNSDVEVSKGWLEPLIALLDDSESVAAAMPRILSWQQRDLFEYAGAAGGFIDRYGYPFCRGRILNSLESDQGQYNDPCELFWASGACMITRKNRFLAAGGLDKEFFAHMEEIDLCWRYKNMGYHILFCPDSKVYHVGGGTLPNESPHKLYLNFRNNLFMLYKNLPDGPRKRILTLRFFLDMAAAIKYLAGFHPGSARAIFRAYADFRRHKSHYKNVRKIWLENHSLQEHREMFPGSILFQFYFRRVRSFRQLPF